MSILDKVLPAPTKNITIFYLIDASSSMSGKRMDIVNKTLKECKVILNDISESNEGIELKIAILKFSSGCEWLTSSYGPSSIKDWEPQDIIASGVTEFGAALNELNDKLSKEKFMKSTTSALAPIIILISDGQPTDMAVWLSANKKISENKWFKHALKFAIDIETSIDTQSNILREFTGSEGSIINVNNIDILKMIIKRVSIRASEYQSHSKIYNPYITSVNEAEEIVNSVLEDIQNQKSLELDSYREDDEESENPNDDIREDDEPIIIGIKDFVVRRNSFLCLNKNHSIENIDALINVMLKKSNDFVIEKRNITAAYCKECDIYFIMESTYEMLCRYGIPICRITDEKTYIRNGLLPNTNMRLAQESPLMQYGYNVSQTENLSEYTRQNILAFLIDNKILSKNEIISYLDFFINQRKARSIYAVAIKRWNDDKEFVRNYKIGSYRKVWVNSIKIK